MNVCRCCGRDIRWTKASDGWVHVLGGSVWCGTEGGLIVGSCSLGPAEVGRAEKHLITLEEWNRAHPWPTA